MLAVEVKPRLTYQQFLQQTKPQPSGFEPGTVAWVLQRYYDKFKDGIGKSQMYTLRRLQKSPHIGPHLALRLTNKNVQEHAEMRIGQGVKPATVGQDCTYLRVALKYAGSAWHDCEGISDAAITAAMPFLGKHNLVSKSTPRDRLPQAEEIAMLREFFRKQAMHRNTKLPMELLMDWQIASGRRIGETCKLLWKDWDREKQTIVVRKMKDPRNKNKRKVVALPDEAQAMLVALEPKRDPSEPRIFPANEKSVGASYTRAKRDLKIIDLRLHDSRAKCYTNMREKGIPGAVAILVTGHETEALPERVYKRMKADQFKELQHVRMAEKSNTYLKQRNELRPKSK